MLQTARQRGQRRPVKSKTSQYRRFRGVNQTDARAAIEDDELFWLENAMTVGNGAIQILPAAGSTVATIAAGVATLWGFILDGAAIVITINSDGSISQVAVPGGVTTEVAPAGTVTTAAHVTIWRDSEVLIVDPDEGYFTWDGATFTVVDIAQVGSAISVFEGRVWIVNGRTITYSAPNSNNDFSAANGAGSTVITDEAFVGNVTDMHSLGEQLWIVGQASIETLSNVQSSGSAPSVTTTFSITNIVSSIGSLAPGSVNSYFRALVLMAPFGVYALSGVTPQKLSDKLDGLFPELTISATSVYAAVAVVQSLPVLVFRVTYTGNNAQAGAGPLALLLCFTQGKWFFAVQRSTLRAITTVVVNGNSEAWGVDTAGAIFKLFGAAATSPVVYKVQSKLYDFGLSTTEKALLKVGIELQASSAIDPTMTVDNEFGSQTVEVTTSNRYTLKNNAGATLQLINALGEDLNLIGQGTLLSRQQASHYGRYLGWTLSGEDPPYRIQAVHFETVETRTWQQP